MLRARSPSFPFLENVFCDRQSRENVRPAGVESKVRQDLRRLLSRESVVHRLVQMIGNLRHLAGSYQCADSDEASITRRKIRAQPQVAEKIIGRVLHHSGRYGAELLADLFRAR